MRQLEIKAVCPKPLYRGQRVVLVTELEQADLIRARQQGRSDTTPGLSMTSEWPEGPVVRHDASADLDRTGDTARAAGGEHRFYRAPGVVAGHSGQPGSRGGP